MPTCPHPPAPPCHNPPARVRGRGAGPGGALQEDGSPFPGHTEARRYLPLARAGRGGKAVNSPVGLEAGYSGATGPVVAGGEGSRDPDPRPPGGSETQPNPTQPNPLCPIIDPKCTPLTPSHASLRFHPTHAVWSSPAVLCRATLSPSAPAQSGAHAAVLWTLYVTRTTERLTENGSAPESPFNGTYIPEHRAAE